jgi:hypothetical protein
MEHSILQQIHEAALEGLSHMPAGNCPVCSQPAPSHDVRCDFGAVLDALTKIGRLVETAVADDADAMFRHEE